MKKFFFLLAVISVVGIVWFGCDMQPSRVNGPDTETGQTAKVALPDVAIEHMIAVQEKHTEKLMALDGIVGTAVGLDEGNNGVVFVLTARPGIAGIPQALEDVPVRVVMTGEFSALKPSNPNKPSAEKINPASRFARPVPIGVSTGHPDITAGTISCRVKDASGNVYALSNNHVYANENDANPGDKVLQPGAYDGGVDPADAIGTLHAFVRIDFSDGASNTVDAAIASTTTELLGNATPSNGYGVPQSTTAAATVGMRVKKYGRTTGLTTNKVAFINATINVQYDSGVAQFVNQIVIGPGRFSAGGDSGSLIVSQNNNPVGLLFAGSSSYTIANPIDAVLDAFGVTVDGQ